MTGDLFVWGFGLTKEKLDVLLILISVLSYAANVRQDLLAFVKVSLMESTDSQLDQSSIETDLSIVIASQNGFRNIREWQQVLPFVSSIYGVVVNQVEKGLCCIVLIVKFYDGLRVIF